MIREFSAGGVVFKGELVLIRRPAPNPEFRGKLGWNLPKGWIDEGETPEQAALREVREEGGVEAKIIKKIKTIKYFYKNEKQETVMKFVTFYQMEWVADLPGGWGWETEEAKWVSRTEAKQLLVNKSERDLVE